MINIVYSIIIITKNEEQNIERCIKSLTELETKYPNEIILIDSNSTDKTRDLASKFKCSIYNLGENLHKSVATGRYVGSKVAKGKYLFFIDGDMEVLGDTNIDKCIELLELNCKVAALSGQLPERVYDENGVLIKSLDDRYFVYKTEERVDMGGVFIIKSEILNEIGNVDIRLDNCEDFDLYYKFSYLGYKFMRTTDLKIMHHTKDVYNKNVVLNRYKRGIYRDMWTVLWRSFYKKKLVQHIKVNSFVVAWTVMLLSMIISLCILMLIDSKVLLIISCITILLTIIYKFLRKGVKYAILECLYATLSAISIFKINKNSKEFDLNKVIKIK